MKALFVVPYPTEAPSNRLRVEQYFPYLEQHGVEPILRPFMSSDLYNIRHAPGSMIRKVASLGFSTMSRFLDIRRADERRRDLRAPRGVPGRRAVHRGEAGACRPADGVRLRRRDLPAEHRPGQPDGRAAEAPEQDGADRQPVHHGDRRQREPEGVRVGLQPQHRGHPDAGGHRAASCRAAARAPAATRRW